VDLSRSVDDINQAFLESLSQSALMGEIPQVDCQNNSRLSESQFDGSTSQSDCVYESFDIARKTEVCRLIYVKI
jgi:hypothetical protein